jgi:hypothetical protein
MPTETPFQSPVLDGFKYEWVEECMDLSGYIGNTLQIRFRFTSDLNKAYDGFYVDDISVLTYGLLSCAHNVQLLREGIDTVRMRANVVNPLAHTLKVVAMLNSSSGELIDSLFLADDGLHGDSASGDGLWGCQYVPKKDDTIHVTLRVDDHNANTSASLPNVVTYIFSRKPILDVNVANITLGLIASNLAHRDTTISISNTGYPADTIRVRIDSVNVSPSTALAVHPTVFQLPGQGSKACTLSVSPGLLSPNIIFAPKIIVDSDSGFGQKHFEIVVRFRIVTTDIADKAAIPTRYGLEQNYPNPFNPATTIRYALPHRSQVLLAVFNTLGQQVATLVQGQQEAGAYDVKFDGSILASGVYFCRIQAGDYVATKKLLLMK